LKKLRITKKEVGGEFINTEVAYEIDFPGEQAQGYLAQIQSKNDEQNI